MTYVSVVDVCDRRPYQSSGTQYLCECTQSLPVQFFTTLVKTGVPTNVLVVDRWTPFDGSLVLYVRDQDMRLSAQASACFCTWSFSMKVCAAIVLIAM